MTLYHKMTTFDATEKKMPFENVVGEGENAGNQHFLLFPRCFLPFQIQSRNRTILATTKLSSANACNLETFVLW